MHLAPITLRQANAFIGEHHRHSRPDRGWKFGVGLYQGETLIGVGVAGRPKARALDDGLTIEITRTCTTGARNANSMLYGALWRAARALGYTRAVTYTQEGETGASLRAAGWTLDADLPPRGSWAESSVKLRGIRHPEGDGGVARRRWTVTHGA